MGLLDFDHVSKTYPASNAAAVNDCTFAVESGDFLVLLGPSGCGKTTLLKMVNRLLEPTDGTIYLDGADIRSLEVTLLRRQIGYVIQQVGLFPHLTVAQNIAGVPELLHWERARIDRRIDGLLELVQLAPQYYRTRYPAQLSGGQQQRVGLARALAADPMLLLMDEPFGAIDELTRASLRQEMLRLKGALNKTVLFVTHDVDEALLLADKIVILRAGHIEQYDMPLKILTAPANEFVRQLVGADDLLRRLSLVTVAQVMTPLAPDTLLNGAATIRHDDDLRIALSKLLQSGAAALTVVADDKPVGRITLEQIRASAKQD